MQRNDLIIDQLTLDVHAENAIDPNQLLLQITGELKNVVLPRLEEKLNQLAIIGDLKIDKLDLNLTELSSTNWQTPLINQILEKIVASSVDSSFNKALENDVTALSSLVRKIHYFLQFGVFENRNDNWSVLEGNGLKLAENDRFFNELGSFLSKNDKYTSRFLQHCSAEFLKKVLNQFINLNWANFLTDLPQLSPKNELYRIKLIKNVIKSKISIHTNFEFSFLRLSKRNLDETTRFLAEIDKKTNKATIKQIKNLKKLMKPNSHEHNKPISQLLRKKSDKELLAFLEYLRSDLAVMALIDPLLKRHYEGITETNILTNWSAKFVESITDKFIVQNLLIELEDLKPINGNIQTPEYFAKELNHLVQNLEDKFESFKDSKLVNEESLATHIPIHNAGIILLNPFLPALFKNLDLLNAENDWHSENHQIMAIYLLHQLATGSFSVTEDKLYLAKIITGYPLDEVLPPFEQAYNMIYAEEKRQVEINPETELNNLWPNGEVQMTNLLTAIQENWRPMRNCTWEGLRNDFLSRPGELERKENLQYILTIEPHTFDVLLSQMQWGMNMIKYSWMDEVLNVEWG